MNIIVHTDGSSMFNGKPECYGGWSAVYDFGGKTYIRYGNLPVPSSNNRGEAYGVLYTMMQFKHRPDWKIKFVSDSQYVVKTLTEWRDSRKNGPEHYANPDLFIPLYKAWDEHGNASISWVRGHTGHPGNELADLYAGLGMRSLIREAKTDKLDVKFILPQDY